VGMGEEKALNVGPSGIEVAYERFGDPAAPPVLLIMAGGAQMINWPEEFCGELVDGGLRVIRFDSPDGGAAGGPSGVHRLAGPIFDGMGHSLPRPLWPEFATHIAELVHRTESITAST
jgi:pimeloyl-ACP methyl ester carboxylesterase